MKSFLFFWEPNQDSVKVIKKAARQNVERGKTGWYEAAADMSICKSETIVMLRWQDIGKCQIIYYY